MNSRREFVKTSLLGASAMALGGQHLFAAATADKPPARFIFLSKGNGLIPTSLVPPSFSDKDKAIDAQKGTLEVNLDKHELAYSERARR